MINALLLLDSRCNSIITQYYRHMDATADENILKFKTQLTASNSLYNTDCVLLINHQSFIFIKYNDIIICAITSTNCNVFNVLSFEYQLIDIIEQYNSDQINAQFVAENVVLILEILNQIIDDGYPQQMFEPPSNTNHISRTDSIDLRKATEVSTSITGNVPWRKEGITHKMGWSVGGAKDINNFRHSIQKQILPKASSLTYNGIFYDYYFQNITESQRDQSPTPDKEEGMNRLFFPSYSYAKCDENYYISVGLNSNLTSDQFKRHKLNLMIILDVSGSMNRSFAAHNDMIEDETTKIEIAKQCLIELISTHIHSDDRFCLLLFNSDVTILQQFEMFENINKGELIQKIKNVKAVGGTDLGKAYQTATVLFDSLREVINFKDEDNRILYLTDAKANLSYTECRKLIDLSKAYSCKLLQNGRIGTTFIGIGIDFNTDLVNKITSELYGSNYYSVHSVQEFKTQMLDEFSLMVSPLIFNLKLHINAEGNSNDYYIDQIYGNSSSSNAHKNGELMNVKSLFPSNSNAENEVKGGIILMKICPLTLRDKNNLNMELRVSYEDRFGAMFENKQKICCNTHENDKVYFANNGIRKSVLLVQYIQLLKEWIAANNAFFVSKSYQKTFAKFLTYFRKEMKIINDKTLAKEISILKKLISSATHHRFDTLSLHRNHEILLQITEKINVLIDNKHSYNNRVLYAECFGKITMNSWLSGMPEIRMGLHLGIQKPKQYLRPRNRYRFRQTSEDLRFHQCVRLARFESENVISFIPPDGRFELLSYKIEDIKSVTVPFDVKHNIKYGLNNIEFDVRLQPKFAKHLIAKDIVIKIPIIGEVLQCINVKCNYGKCEVKGKYLIWSMKSVIFERKPKLFGKFNYLGNNLRYDREASQISVQFKMENVISSCVKVMYLKVSEKSGYKAFKRVEYRTETDDVANIKFQM